MLGAAQPAAPQAGELSWPLPHSLTSRHLSGGQACQWWHSWLHLGLPESPKKEKKEFWTAPTLGHISTCPCPGSASAPTGRSWAWQLLQCLPWAANHPRQLPQLAHGHLARGLQMGETFGHLSLQAGGEPIQSSGASKCSPLPQLSNGGTCRLKHSVPELDGKSRPNLGMWGIKMIASTSAIQWRHSQAESLGT